METITLFIRISLIFLIIIGLLKLVSLFILLLLHIYYHYKGNDIVEVHKDSSFYIENDFYIIPTIVISHTNKYFEIVFHWLKLEYYESTTLEFETDEK